MPFKKSKFTFDVQKSYLKRRKKELLHIQTKIGGMKLNDKIEISENLKAS